MKIAHLQVSRTFLTKNGEFLTERRSENEIFDLIFTSPISPDWFHSTYDFVRTSGIKVL